MNCGRAFSFASTLRQSCSVAHERASCCIVLSCTPCDVSATVSRSGHCVAAMRRRRSTSFASGTSMRNARMAFSSAAPAEPARSRLAAPAAAEVARTSRRVAGVSGMTFSFVPSVCSKCPMQLNTLHWRAARRARAKISDRFAEWPERGAKLGTEELRLFPGGEVSAFVDFVEVDQVAIGAPGPRFRGSVDLVRKNRDGHRERDLDGLLRSRKDNALSAVLPIQTR